MENPINGSRIYENKDAFGRVKHLAQVLVGGAEADLGTGLGPGVRPTTAGVSALLL